MGRCRRGRGGHVRKGINCLTDPRDSEALSISLMQMDALFRDLKHEDPEIWNGAGSGLKRLVQQQSIHNIKMRDPRSDDVTRARAKRASDVLQDSLREIEKRLPELLTHLDRFRRIGIATFAREMIESAENRESMQPPYALKQLLIPLVMDSDISVRCNAVQELRNAFHRDPGRLARALEIEGREVDARSAASAALLKRGIPQKEIDELVGYVRALVQSELIIGDINVEYRQNHIPVDMVAVDVMPYLNQPQPAEFFRDILILASYKP